MYTTHFTLIPRENYHCASTTSLNPLTSSSCSTLTPPAALSAALSGDTSSAVQPAQSASTRLAGSSGSGHSRGSNTSTQIASYPPAATPHKHHQYVSDGRGGGRREGLTAGDAAADDACDADAGVEERGLFGRLDRHAGERAHLAHLCAYVLCAV